MVLAQLCSHMEKRMGYQLTPKKKKKSQIGQKI